FSNLFLQLDEPIRHRVERVAELADFVVPGDRDALVHTAIGDGARDARQREDALDERSTPDPPENHRAEQREADRYQQLPLELLRQQERIVGWLLDDDRPA